MNIFFLLWLSLIYFRYFRRTGQIICHDHKINKKAFFPVCNTFIIRNVFDIYYVYVLNILSFIISRFVYYTFNYLMIVIEIFFLGVMITANSKFNYRITKYHDTHTLFVLLTFITTFVQLFIMNKLSLNIIIYIVISIINIIDYNDLTKHNCKSDPEYRPNNICFNHLINHGYIWLYGFSHV